MVLFGLRADEVSALKSRGYDPLAIYNKNDKLRQVLNHMSRGFKNGESFSDLVSKLVYGGDEYMLLADYDSYVEAHDRLYTLMTDKEKRSAVSLRNIARSGVFAADRAVADYAKNIWKV